MKMAIKELRLMKKKGGKEKTKAVYIGMLQDAGKLKKYISDKGYVAYDTEEYKKYKATVKRGRPLKNKGE